MHRLIYYGIYYITYPNYYWNFPLYVFLHKYGDFDGESFELPEERNDEFLQLLEFTVKYFFVKGVVYNSVNYVKDAVFKTCVAIEAEKVSSTKNHRMAWVERDLTDPLQNQRTVGLSWVGLEESLKITE